MIISTFEHPFLSGLSGCPDMLKLFDAAHDVECMLKFESALAKVQGELGIIPGEAAKNIIGAVSRFTPDYEKLNAATAIDGVVIPELVRQLRDRVAEPFSSHLHFGVTSQDVIDTSLAIRLKFGMEILAEKLANIQGSLEILKMRFGDNRLMARTRMQNALPTTVSQHIQLWQAPLTKHSSHLSTLTKEVAVLQLGGSIGNGEVFGDNYDELTKRMAKALGLSIPTQCWHTDRSSLANLANWLSLVTGSLGKIGRDVTLMNLNEISEISLSAAGSSSAMPHKKNPVKAEMLITLADFNATQLPAIHLALQHQNHRCGNSWTLEWMVLPQMMMATAASVRTAEELVAGVTDFGRQS